MLGTRGEEVNESDRRAGQSQSHSHSTLANPEQTSLQRTKQIGTQALLTWLPHPGTAIYLGYNDDLQNLDKSLCNREPNGQCDPNNTVPPRAPYYINDGRQFFLKASYLIRF